MASPLFSTYHSFQCSRNNLSDCVVKLEVLITSITDFSRFYCISNKNKTCKDKCAGFILSDIQFVNISVLTGAHLHRSKVKHARVECLAQGYNIELMSRR